MTRFTADQYELMGTILIGAIVVAKNLVGAAPSLVGTADQIAQEARKERRRTWLVWCGGIMLAFGLLRLMLLHHSTTLHSRGGFSVTFPGSVYEVPAIQSMGGVPVTLYHATCDDDGITYDSGTFDRPKGLLFNTDMFVAGMATQWGAPTHRFWVEVDGFSGEQISFRSADGTELTMRLFLGKEKVCVLSQSVPAARVGDPEITTFFESHHFNKS